MSIRLFIAIELPAVQKQRLEDIQSKLKRKAPAVRWVNPKNIHLTLKFLGDMEENSLPEVEKIVDACARECRPCSIRLCGVGAFPNIHSPRVIWVGIQDESGTLKTLAQKLESLLTKLGVEEDGRPYSPHLTLGRVKEKIRGMSFSDALSPLKGEEAGEVMVDEISLIRSDLTPHGPIYTILHQARLG